MFLTRKPTKEYCLIFSCWGGTRSKTKTIGPACLLIFGRMSGVSRRHLHSKYLPNSAETTDDFLFRLLSVCVLRQLVSLTGTDICCYVAGLFIFLLLSTWHTAGQLYLIIPYKAINANDDAQVLYNAIAAAAAHQKKKRDSVGWRRLCVMLRR